MIQKFDFQIRIRSNELYKDHLSQNEHRQVVDAENKSADYLRRCKQTYLLRYIEKYLSLW